MIALLHYTLWDGCGIAVYGRLSGVVVSCFGGGEDGVSKDLEYCFKVSLNACKWPFGADDFFNRDAI